MGLSLYMWQAQDPMRPQRPTTALLPLSTIDFEYLALVLIIMRLTVAKFWPSEYTVSKNYCEALMHHAIDTDAATDDANDEDEQNEVLNCCWEMLHLYHRCWWCCWWWFQWWGWECWSVEPLLRDWSALLKLGFSHIWCCRVLNHSAAAEDADDADNVFIISSWWYR